MMGSMMGSTCIRRRGGQGVDAAPRAIGVLSATLLSATLLSTTLFSTTLLSLGLVLSPLSVAAGQGGAGFDTVVIDAGHGGRDHGARSRYGLAEKEVVLDVSQRLAARLRERGLKVHLTRDGDHYVPLVRRTSLANATTADLFISVHANSAETPRPSGVETYFVSLDASDAQAGRLALRENDAFEGVLPGPASQDPLAALLGDLVVTEHLHESSEFAKLVQHELADLGGGDARGVKQAPFVVLMGVEMPAVLVEIGFLSNVRDEGELRSPAHREAIALSVSRAVEAFGKRYDARRGIRRGAQGRQAAR